MRTTAQSITSRVLATVLVGAGAAGCGSSTPPSATTGSSARASTPGAAAFAFSHCMREHGVPNFPDPKVTTSPGQESVRVAMPAPRSSQAKAAMQACSHLLPGPQNASPAGQRAREQALLAFARCLRGHGIVNFPDPDNQGQLSLQTITAAGVDLHAPGFLTAARSCVGVTHGAITGADVERAINGPH
ncbi:MAG TPA: hypothetical protein VG325_03705 [Solirubrobacteraceae bacterium]|nr:hypothetical protein [Solirubrobacteraceae bacterium]